MVIKSTYVQYDQIDGDDLADEAGGCQSSPIPNADGHICQRCFS